MAGIQLGSGFDLNSPIPLDSRTQVDTIALRDAIPTGNRYEGLLVYVKADKKYYSLAGGVANTNWSEMPTSQALAQINTALNGKASTQQVETLTTQLASTVKKVNGVAPSADGNVTITVSGGEVDTSNLATKIEVETVANRLSDKANLQDLEAVSEQLGNIGTPSTQDAVGEWWIYPLATFQESPYPRTVMGGISSTGKILAIEHNHATLKKSRYEIAQAVVDDHCVPALYVGKGRRSVIAWTHHNTDHILRFKVGNRSGELASLVNAEEINFYVGANTSYNQIHLIDSNETKDVFLMFYRHGNVDWRAMQFEVNQLNGELSVVFDRSVVSAPGQQCYISTVPGEDNNIRIAWGYNPARPVHAIYYMELNLETGAITSPYSPSLNANLFNNTNLPIVDSSISPMIPEPPTGNSRRFFYTRGGSDSHAVAYADWELGKEDEAVYKVSENVYIPPVTSNIKSIAGQAFLESVQKTEFNSLLEGGFELTSTFELTSAPLGDIEFIRKSTSGAKGTFYLRLMSDFKIRSCVGITGTPRGYSSTVSVPEDWENLRGIKATYTHDTKEFKFYYKKVDTDWILLETVPVVITGAMTFTDEPIIIGTFVTPFQAPNKMYSATVKKLDGTLIAGFENFDSFTSPSKTDAAGITWNDVGGVKYTAPTIEETKIVTHEFGISGARLGYTPEANYLAGMAFEYPSYDKSVITVHTDGVKETIKKWRFINGSYSPETLLEADTTNGRIVRPYSPLNGGPTPAIATRMTKYTAYTDYVGDIITT